jgi:hypothetical protein
MTVFWIAAPCNLVEVCRRFRGAYCLHHNCHDDGGSKCLWGASELSPIYTAQHVRLAVVRIWNLTHYKAVTKESSVYAYALRLATAWHFTTFLFIFLISHMIHSYDPSLLNICNTLMKLRQIISFSFICCLMSVRSKYFFTVHNFYVIMWNKWYYVGVKKWVAMLLLKQMRVRLCYKVTSSRSKFYLHLNTCDGYENKGKEKQRRQQICCSECMTTWKKHTSNIFHHISQSHLYSSRHFL